MEEYTMNVNFDYDLCTNCGICVRSCPIDVIRVHSETKKVTAIYDQDCMLCKMCEYDCPQNCIFIAPNKQITHILSWG